MYRAKLARGIVEQARAQVTLSRLLGAIPHAAVATLVEAVESLDHELQRPMKRFGFR